MVFKRRLKRFAVAAAIGGLLLNAAAPLIVNAAAALAGVPTGALCEVYGVPVAVDPSPAHPHDHAAMAMGDADHASMAMDDVDATTVPEHHQAPALHGGDHCALLALATFAPPGPADLAPRVASTAIGRAVPSAVSRAVFDATARWVLGLKTGPPTTA